MGEILAIIAGIITIFNAVDFLLLGTSRKNLKVEVVKILIGLLLVGAGLVMKHFGI